MNSLALTFVLLSALAVLLLPRRWAPVPLLTGACYMTLGQGIDAGPFTFTVIRILVAVGIIRMVVRGERLAGGLNRMDWLMFVWACWVCVCDRFHDDPETGLVFRLGLVYNAVGFYILLRVWCASLDDAIAVCRATSLILVPVAAEMIYEHLAFHNLFSVFGGVSEVPQVREGHIRASGPFAHPILAGTVGAVCLPLAIGIWRSHKKTAVLGAIACIAIVLSSRSSGPFMTGVFAIVSLLNWPNRYRMRMFRWLAVCFYVALDIVMAAPAYYLIARIDIAGGSTGWHRARLIESSLAHLSEWWLTGTDYTRQWMPTGVSWNLRHTDITNHYLQMGVWGGLPLMFLFIAVLVKGFSFAGGRVLDEKGTSSDHRFLAWALGSSLFAHVATCISVSYFDQSVFFIYLTLAIISSIRVLEFAEAPARADKVMVRPAGAAVRVPLAAARFSRAGLKGSG